MFQIVLTPAVLELALLLLAVIGMSLALVLILFKRTRRAALFSLIPIFASFAVGWEVWQQRTNGEAQALGFRSFRDLALAKKYGLATQRRGQQPDHPNGGPGQGPEVPDGGQRGAEG